MGLASTNQRRVMLIHDDAERACWVGTRLRERGFDTGPPVTEYKHVLREVSAQVPDMLIVDAQSENHALLDSLAIVSSHHPLPMLMYSAQETASYIQRAVAAGVSNYLVGKLDPAKLPPMLEVALANFQQQQHLQQQLDQACAELAERVNIDKAKLQVMQRLSVDEAEAYSQLRKEAMNCGLSIADVSKRILAATST